VAAINAFSVRGIRIRIDRSWFIAFLLFAWTLGSGYYPQQIPDYPAFTYWIAGYSEFPGSLCLRLAT
jgi:hypothetical protein